MRLQESEKVNIDAEIKAAKERINRQIGQWGRHAHAEVKRRVNTALYVHKAGPYWEAGERRMKAYQDRVIAALIKGGD